MFRAMLQLKLAYEMPSLTVRDSIIVLERGACSGWGCNANFMSVCGVKPEFATGKDRQACPKPVTALAQGAPLPVPFQLRWSASTTAAFFFSAGLPTLFTILPLSEHNRAPFKVFLDPV